MTTGLGLHNSFGSSINCCPFCESLCFMCCLITGQGAVQACDRLANLQEFRSSQVVKVNPDRPQQQARFVTLEVSVSCWIKAMTGPFRSFPLTQGAITACSRMSKLRVFTKATEVKVDPDKTLECARLAVLQVALWSKHTHTTRVPQRTMFCFHFITVNCICLVYNYSHFTFVSLTILSSQAQKTLLVPTPRLRTGLFNKITPPQGANKEQLRKCASSQVSVC